MTKFFSYNILLNSILESSKWQDWGSWTSCEHNDGTIANCWKDKNDFPRKTRQRKCIPETSTNDEYEVCQTETQTCTELDVCPFSK